MYKKSILSIKSNPNNPPCDHGPSILFETDKSKYYACSAFRDPKICNFKLKFNDIKKKVNIPRKDISFKIKDFLACEKNKRFYCHDCCKLFTSDNKEKNSINCIKRKHKIESNISQSNINYPTRLLSAFTNNKSNAQYLFSDDFLNYLLMTFKIINTNKIICIGAPRLHETIIQEENINIQSFLLDIDERLMQFHEDNFGLYNMFNNYFLIEDHANRLDGFIENNGNNKTILLFCDPPFGGLLEPLVTSLNALKEKCESKGYIVRKMLILPYFLGKKLAQFSNDLKMLDYRVQYDNHKRMDKPDDLQSNLSQGNRRESIVRIFTDINESDIKPPNLNNYWYCSVCCRYSHIDNKHCIKCQKCPTRHGPSYVHCEKCNKCRQPSKRHCDKCGFCNPHQHNCDSRK